MTTAPRAVLDRELINLSDNILKLGSLVGQAIEQAMTSLYNRDLLLAQQVVADDQAINLLRYNIEESALVILATQQPAAKDLRQVIASIHIAVELERIGDHASGIARLVDRMEEEDTLISLHKLPKMAKQAQKMLEDSLDAYAQKDADLAWKVLNRDDKIDKNYNKLFRQTLEEMQDQSYIQRATFLLWIGHNLERIGDRASNVAERVIFMVKNEIVEIDSDLPD